MLERYIRFGISPTVLFPECTQGPLQHLAAFTKAAVFPGYEMLETFLPDDDKVRAEEIRIAREEGKGINYNFPIDFQVPGRYNPCSFSDEELRSAIDYACLHIEHAAEAGSHIIAITSGPDYMPGEREKEYARFAEYLRAISSKCREHGIGIAIETAERHRFKKLLMGPSLESAMFIRGLRDEGLDNVYLMVDTAHCPLMEEDPIDVLHNSLIAGINHIHIGNAVVSNERSIFYGHTHPAIGIPDGCYDVSDVAIFLKELFRCGYLRKNTEYSERPCLSYEMRCYDGTSPMLSAKVAHDKMDAAFMEALG